MSGRIGHEIGRLIAGNLQPIAAPDRNTRTPHIGQRAPRALDAGHEGVRRNAHTQLLLVAPKRMLNAER